MSRKTHEQALKDGSPWGYDVEVYFNNGNPSKTFHKAGTIAEVKRWAILKPNHERHEIGESYTREQWIRCFGDGRLK
jgi:hypothetical protein